MMMTHHTLQARAAWSGTRMSSSLAGALDAGTAVYSSILMKMKAVGAGGKPRLRGFPSSSGRAFASAGATASIARRLATSAGPTTPQAGSSPSSMEAFSLERPVRWV